MFVDLRTVIARGSIIFMGLILYTVVTYIIKRDWILTRLKLHGSC